MKLGPDLNQGRVRVGHTRVCVSLTLFDVNNPKSESTLFTDADPGSLTPKTGHANGPYDSYLYQFWNF